MPQWVTTGYLEYAKRLPPGCTLRLVEIPLGYRGKGQDPQRAIAEEGERMLKLIPANAWVIAMEVGGHVQSTAELAAGLWQHLASGRDLALLVGGPDGLSTACIERADASWSLSRLTFPHALVRIILVEQLYRVLCILQRHPYHRA